jgi:hypothetical protein
VRGPERRALARPQGAAAARPAGGGGAVREASSLRNPRAPSQTAALDLTLTPPPPTNPPPHPPQVLKDLGVPHYHHELVKEALEVQGGAGGITR